MPPFAALFLTNPAEQDTLGALLASGLDRAMIRLIVFHDLLPRAIFAIKEFY